MYNFLYFSLTKCQKTAVNNLKKKFSGSQLLNQPRHVMRIETPNYYQSLIILAIQAVQNKANAIIIISKYQNIEAQQVLQYLVKHSTKNVLS